MTHNISPEEQLKSPNPDKQTELENRLFIQLKHTLKLVPQSQRELFVSELAEWYAKDRAAYSTAVVERVIGENEGHKWESCKHGCVCSMITKNQMRTNQRQALATLDKELGIAHNPITEKE